MRSKSPVVKGMLLTSIFFFPLVTANSMLGRIFSPPSSGCDPAVETHISGDFEGWDDEKIYKMDNGQIWQQANYHYHYHYAYHPSVIIYKSSTGCRIKVEGDDDEGVTVQRLK